MPEDYRTTEGLSRGFVPPIDFVIEQEEVKKRSKSKTYRGYHAFERMSSSYFPRSEGVDTVNQA